MNADTLPASYILFGVRRLSTSAQIHGERLNRLSVLNPLRLPTAEVQ
jgi:hypothetical protein